MKEIIKMQFLYLFFGFVYAQINTQQDNHESQSQEYINTDDDQDVNWGPLFYIVGLFIVVVFYLSSKSKPALQIAEETMQQKMTKFISSKGLANKDTITRLSEVLALFETHNLKLRYKQFNNWFVQETVNINVNINIDVLVVNIVGTDTYGKWQLNGTILVNKEKLLVCLLNKVYEETFLQGGDLLYYSGVYNEKEQKFAGNWQYAKSGESDEWDGQFIEK